MAIEEEDSGGGIPEWVVTFGDMMSLLLTFFIMLVSLSEIKEVEKYQALVDSIQQQFGYSSSTMSTVPGPSKPRNAERKAHATMGRARRLDTHRGGSDVEAPVGDHKEVVIVRPGSDTAVGAAIFFDDNSDELSDAYKLVLQQQADLVKGKPQKIEVRGHTSFKPLAPASKHADHWELAYQRCRRTMEYLVDELGIEAQRIRLSVAGPYEPIHIGTDADKLRDNARVEVFLLDEVIKDFSGTPEQRQKQFTEQRAQGDG